MRDMAWTGAIVTMGALAGILAGANPARAQKSADTLRVAWRDAIADVDPYFNQQRTGLVLAHQVWDCLIYRDAETFQIKPLLATAWRYADPTTLEFDLRHDVKFHDGSPFSADDVVYTVETILTDKNVSVPSLYEFIAGAERIDDFKVRIRLKRVFPAALEYISMVLPILPRAYRTRVGADGFAKAPVGAGPYRISRVDGTTEIDLERFSEYYADSAKGKPAIGRIVIHEVADSSAELSDLLGGRADWIWNYPPDAFNTIAAVPSLQATRAESMRIGYMQLDAAGRTGADNPLTNVKVRKAMFYAIDRQTIATQIAQAGSRVPDAPCFPTQFGCDTAAATRYAYSPEKARSLLAEAGYPHGFATELVSYVLPQYGAAIENYLRAVGINARITQVPVADATQLSLDGKTPLYLGSWGSYSINDVSAILPYFFGGGASDYTRDPDIETLVAEGGATTNPDERRHFYAEAIHRITENADFLPLNTYVTLYAFSRALNFKAFPDELPRFFLASWR